MHDARLRRLPAGCFRREVVSICSGMIFPQRPSHRCRSQGWLTSAIPSHNIPPVMVQLRPFSHGKPLGDSLLRCMSPVVALSGGLRDDSNPSAVGSQADMSAGEDFFQPAAAKVGVPPRWKWGGRKRNYLPPTLSDRMRARADFHKCDVGKRGARINDP
jgi:hypothetical protein